MILLILAAGILAVVFVLSLRRPWGAIWLALLASLAVFPRAIFTIAPPVSAWHVGITTESIQIRTYSVALVLALIVLAVKRVRVRMPRPGAVTLAAVLCVFFAVMALFVWPDSQVIEAGLLHIATAIAALIVGIGIGDVLRRGEPSELWLARILFVVVLIQLPVVLLQLGGIQLFPTDSATTLFEGDRPNGTFGHPGTLGKVFFILLLLILPLTRSVDRAARRLALSSVFLMVPIVVITASRTNSAAIASAIVLWFVFVSGARLSQKVVALGLVATVAFISLPLWVERIATGEDGSTRARLMDVAVEQISLRPFSGTGPNNYIPLVSQTEATAAAGWPVHNVWMLAWAELGIFGVILVLGPVVMVLLRSTALTVGGSKSAFARAAMIAIPGLVMIATTGWGLLAELLPLWYLVMGVVWSHVFRGREAGPDSLAVGTRLVERRSVAHRSPA